MAVLPPPQLVGRTSREMWIEWVRPSGRYSEFEVQVSRSIALGLWDTVAVVCATGVQLRGLDPGRKLRVRVRGRDSELGTWEAWSRVSPEFSTLRWEGGAPTHMVVLVPDDDAEELNLLGATLEATFQPDVVAVTSVSNLEAQYRLGGVLGAGHRLASEIMQAMACHIEVEAISFVCKGLGGLFARACLRPLTDLGKMRHLHHLNFITIGTPHMGVRSPPYLGLSGLIHRNVADELMRRDNELTTPVLEQLSRRVYLEPLARFQRPVLYASAHPEADTPYFSAAIRIDEPHEALFVPGQPTYTYFDNVEPRRHLQWPLVLNQGGGLTILPPSRLPPQPEEDDVEATRSLGVEVGAEDAALERSFRNWGGGSGPRRGGGGGTGGASGLGTGSSSEDDDDEDRYPEEEVGTIARDRANSRRVELIRDGSSVVSLAQSLNEVPWNRVDVIGRDMPTRVTIFSSDADMLVAHITAHMLMLKPPTRELDSGSDDEGPAAGAGDGTRPRRASDDTRTHFNRDRGYSATDVAAVGEGMALLALRTPR